MQEMQNLQLISFPKNLRATSKKASFSKFMCEKGIITVWVHLRGKNEMTKIVLGADQLLGTIMMSKNHILYNSESGTC